MRDSCYAAYNMFKNIKICKRKYAILSPIYILLLHLDSSYNNFIVFFHMPLILHLHTFKDFTFSGF